MGAGSSSQATAKYDTTVVDENYFKSLSKNINTFTANTIMEVASKQSASISQLQKIDLQFGNVEGDLVVGDVSQKQTANLTFDAVNVNNFSNQLANGILDKMTNALKNDFTAKAMAQIEANAEAKSKTGFLSIPQATNSSTNVDFKYDQKNIVSRDISNILENSITNNLTMKSLNECISRVQQQQKYSLVADNVKGNVKIGAITQEMASSSLTKCINQTDMGGNIVNQVAKDLGITSTSTSSTDLTTKMSAEAKSEQVATGLFEDLGNMFSNIFGGIFGAYAKIAGIISVISIIGCIALSALSLAPIILGSINKNKQNNQNNSEKQDMGEGEQAGGFWYNLLKQNTNSTSWIDFSSCSM